MGRQRGTRVAAALLAGLVSVSAAACGTRGSAPAAAPAPDTVSIGYGTQARADVTGAVTSLTAEELERTRVARVEELLQGRVPGLQVLRTGAGGFSLHIRGTNSIYGSTEALVVIDGMPVHPGGLVSALAGLHPQDVARIDVLKDAGATAIYGSRGANGVILITTKRRR